MDGYTTVLGEAFAETLIEKSRFIARIKHVETEDEARAFIGEIRKKEYTATHNTWAYVVGEDGKTVRSSDDGEPTGTAGIPMATTLTAMGLNQVVVVVTRYFGGIKLGAGGLVRAYKNAVKAAILSATTVIAERLFFYELRVPYDKLAGVKLATERYGKITAQDFTDGVKLSCSVKANGAAEFIRKLTEILGKEPNLVKTGEGFGAI